VDCSHALTPHAGGDQLGGVLGSRLVGDGHSETGGDRQAGQQNGIVAVLLIGNRDSGGGCEEPTHQQGSRRHALPANAVLQQDQQDTRGQHCQGTQREHDEGRNAHALHVSGDGIVAQGDHHAVGRKKYKIFKNENSG